MGSVVPSIWLLELDKLDKRLGQLSASSLLESAQQQVQIREPSGVHSDVYGNVSLPEGSGKDGSQLHLPPALTKAIPSELWVTLLEQSLMLALILGRWLLPKGELTREQLSQLLLVYIGTAADIIEFLDSFKEDRVARQPILVTLTLSIWAWSLLQFTLVLTATKARRSRMSSSAIGSMFYYVLQFSSKKEDAYCCSVDAWAIVINMILQDAPFVAFRLLLIIHFQIVSYLNVFFACKNTLVILLQLYRLYVVQVERRKQIKRRRGRAKTVSKAGRHEKRRGPLSEGVAVVGGPELYRYGKELKLQRSRSGNDSDGEDSDNVADELRSVRSSPCAARKIKPATPTRYKDRRKSLSTGDLKGFSESELAESEDGSERPGPREVVTLKELKEIRRRASD
ncbi:hypothetical protein J437_LFUL005307 [Ladona fulva]|uniref:Transmembrane protein 26 n=1 Tax=Ladona fulva TaxID=123851 RepID=A0A8K0JYK3_LADFU|nr:hypothetical protein J437_LFUL005307 [Ladona fulva]